MTEQTTQEAIRAVFGTETPEETAARCNTITEFNAELLRQYAQLLEVEDKRGAPRLQVATIYELARKAHITLAGKGGIGKLERRIENLLPILDRQEPYELRRCLCENLMKAVVEASAYRICWDVYIETAASAHVWLDNFDRKQKADGGQE